MYLKRIYLHGTLGIPHTGRSQPGNPVLMPKFILSGCFSPMLGPCWVLGHLGFQAHVVTIGLSFVSEASTTSRGQKQS